MGSKNVLVFNSVFCGNILQLTVGWFPLIISSCDGLKLWLKFQVYLGWLYACKTLIFLLATVSPFLLSIVAWYISPSCLVKIWSVLLADILIILKLGQMLSVQMYSRLPLCLSNMETPTQKHQVEFCKPISRHSSLKLAQSFEFVSCDWAEMVKMNIQPTDI